MRLRRGNIIEHLYRCHRLSVMEYAIGRAAQRALEDHETRRETIDLLSRYGFWRGALRAALCEQRRVIKSISEEARGDIAFGLELLLQSPAAPALLEIGRMKMKDHGGMNIPKGFENSKFDKDKPGVKEGSKADRKQDARDIPKFVAAQKGRGKK